MVPWPGGGCSTTVGLGGVGRGGVGDGFTCIIGSGMIVYTFTTAV